MNCAGLTAAPLARCQVEEHAGGAKHLQELAGVRAPVYWLANYAADAASGVGASAALLVIFAAGCETFSGANAPAVRSAGRGNQFFRSNFEQHRNTATDRTRKSLQTVRSSIPPTKTWPALLTDAHVSRK